jgi:hypothetical protein
MPRPRDDLVFRIPRGQKKSDRKGGGDARQHGQEAIRAEGKDVIGMGGIEQRHHGGSIAGEDRSVGHEPAQDIARPRAKADPKGKAEDEDHRLPVGDEDEQHPGDRSGQGSRRPKETLLDEHVACRLRGGKHRHGRPLRMLQPDEPGDQQGQAGPQGRAERVAEADRIESET